MRFQSQRRQNTSAMDWLTGAPLVICTIFVWITAGTEEWISTSLFLSLASFPKWKWESHSATRPGGRCTQIQTQCRRKHELSEWSRDSSWPSEIIVFQPTAKQDRKGGVPLKRKGPDLAAAYCWQRWTLQQRGAIRKLLRKEEDSWKPTERVDWQRRK